MYNTHLNLISKFLFLCVGYIRDWGQWNSYFRLFICSPRLSRLSLDRFIVFSCWREMYEDNRDTIKFIFSYNAIGVWNCMSRKGWREFTQISFSFFLFNFFSSPDILCYRCSRSLIITLCLTNTSDFKQLCFALPTLFPHLTEKYDPLLEEHKTGAMTTKLLKTNKKETLKQNKTLLVWILIFSRLFLLGHLSNCLLHSF